MIKTITVCQCDICGKIEEAKPVGNRYYETIYGPPEGWETGAVDKEVHICPVCAQKLNRAIRETIRERSNERFLA